MSHVATSAPRSPACAGGSRCSRWRCSRPGAACSPPPARADTDRPASEPLVVLLRDHVARTRPSVRARRIEPVAARRPLTRVRTVLPVIDRETSRDGRAWIRVRLPGRPTGHTGWIPASHTRLKSTTWRIEVTPSTRRVTVYRDGRVTRRFRAIVGTASTPTPRGRFFIEEASRWPRSPTAARTRWPPAPARTSSRSSRAAPARSPCTAPRASRARSGPRPRTAASG